MLQPISSKSQSTKEVAGQSERLLIDCAIPYRASKGLDAYVQTLRKATPMQVVRTERAGVPQSLVKDLSKRMGLSIFRLHCIIGLPRTTADRVATRSMIVGSSALAILGIVKLLGIAQEIVGNSTAREAQDFDTAKWLGAWIELPQPSLGGYKPADLLDTPTGFQIVARLLGAIENGSYQ